jgi:hypothetical protein
MIEIKKKKKKLKYGYPKLTFLKVLKSYFKSDERSRVISEFFGVIIFSPMNYQLLRKAPTNYQLDQNRAFNYQRQPFSPLPSVKGVKTNGQRVT